MNIAGYRIKKRIGQGGMAKVYLAIQKSLDRPVALKVLSPVFGESAEFTERFLNEGRMLASLRHPNIVTIYDIGVDAGMHFISMEYVEGMDLKTRLREGISPSTALDYIETLASCLKVAHERNIVHRDIKPGNVLFRDDDTLLLTDFGIAKKLGEASDLTIAGSMMGTPNYLSPEQAQAKQVDGRSDIYSLGVMLYEMLVGQKPYKGDSDIDTALKHISEPIPALSGELRAFQRLVNKMMAKAPADRFSDVAELIRAIRAFRIDELELLSALDSTHADQMSLPDIEPQSSSAPTRPSPEITAGDTQVDAPDFTPTFVVAKQSKPTLPTDIAESDGLPTSMSRINDDVDREADTVVPQSMESNNNRRFPLLDRVTNLTVLCVLLAAGTGWWMIHSQNPPARVDDKEELARNVAETPRTVERFSAQEQANAEPASERREAELIAAMPADNPALPGKDKDAEATISEQETIERLLGQAEAALANLRLTKPPEESAFRYFQQVQEIAPGNEQAQAGYTRIANKYAELARSQMNKRAWAKATAFVDTGLEIDPANPQLLAVRQQIAQGRTAVPPQKQYKEDSPRELFERVKGFFD